MTSAKLILKKGIQFYSFLVALLFPVESAFSQSIQINTVNGQTFSWPLTQIRSIKFPDDLMCINLNDGSVSCFPLENVEGWFHYNDDIVTNIDSNIAKDGGFVVFPNPLLDGQQLSLSSVHPINGRFVITDNLGKTLHSFEAISEGKGSHYSQIVYFQEPIPSGMYFLLLQNQNEGVVMSSKFIVR